MPSRGQMNPAGSPIDASNYRRDLKRVARKAGLGELRTHDLRHTAGPLLFDAGLPMKVISEHLGHSSECVTADLYVHTADASRG
ncbi:MAG: tyrosine-type recombinase/integrase [Actinomycetes bacterium]